MPGLLLCRCVINHKALSTLAISTVSTIAPVQFAYLRQRNLSAAFIRTGTQETLGFEVLAI
mgnify:CR=1 FL=1